MSKSNEIQKAAPFVKWAGGKRQLLPLLTVRLPENFDTYYEPFVGGGALFFAISPTKAVLGDANKALINVYTCIQNQTQEFLSALTIIDNDYHKSADKKAFYYEKRAAFNALISANEYTVKTAALFVFINKHCFNGLYRVNAKGLFNVPFNASLATSFDKENIILASQALSRASVQATDFEALVKNAKQGDFVFFDSPYDPIKKDSFTSYTKEDFTYNDHVRLARVFIDLSHKGVLCMLTNHDTELIEELYKDFIYERVHVRRSISSKASKRTGVEVIVRNYTTQSDKALGKGV